MTKFSDWSLESSIDELYKGSLGDFVSARTALAKTLSGAEARRVKTLPKPTVVPWVVNQIYWRARPLYERAVQTGGALRAAQVSALEGGKADVRGATDRHRQAIAAAVAEAKRIAEAAGVHPNPDDVGRTLEGLSMTADPPESPGRLTQQLLAASGFEALAGIAVKEVPVRPVRDVARDVATSAGKDAAKGAGREAAAAAEKRKAEVIRQAEAAVARAEAAEASAREAWDSARKELRKAEDALTSLREG